MTTEIRISSGSTSQTLELIRNLSEMTRAIADTHSLNPDMIQQLGESMASPIRRNLDYTVVASRLFAVDPLPDGANPLFFEAIEEVEEIFDGADDFTNE